MGILKKLGKSGFGGIAGLAAANPDIANKVARKGGFGFLGLMAAKKKRAQEKAGGMRGRPAVEDIMMAEQVPASRAAPIMAGDVDAMMGRSAQDDMSGMKKGGKVKKMAAGGAIDKPKPKPMPLPTSPRRVPPSLLPTKPPPKGRAIQKYAKGGSTASKRGDGCATKGKTKGRFV